jgi:uncharacterized protein YbjT (DUF2867 family)
MILVTGAGGQTGRALIGELAKEGLPSRAMVRSERSAQAVRASGASDVVTGDLADGAALAAAMRGVAAVHHICPNFHVRELAIGAAMIAAARAAGVRRFVFHSVINPQCAAMPHHDDKRVVESLLMESGLDWTVLQPTMYMQSTVIGWEAIRASGSFTPLYAVDRRMGLVDLADVAQAACRVLREPGWSGGCFELASGEPLTATEMAAAMGARLGTPVRAVRGDAQAWAARQRAAGMPEGEVARGLAMFAHYDRHGLPGGNGRVLAMLLGRAPRRYAEFLGRIKN